MATVAARGVSALRDVFGGMRGGLAAFLGSGPAIAAVPPARAASEDRSSRPPGEPAAAAVHAAFARARGYFLTQDGKPRSRMVAKKSDFRTSADYERHRDLVIGHAPRSWRAYASYRRDLNALVARGVWRMYAIAERQYRATLDAHAVLDFPDVLLYTLKLLGQMEEFSQSRYRLESRYHHVLVDEFQDTSRAQWELVSLLVRAWGEGAGLALSGPARADGVHRRRPQAVDLRVPRRRRGGARRSRPRHRAAAPGRRRAPVDFAQLPLGAGAAGLRQRRVRRHRQAAGPRRRVRLRRGRRLSRSTIARDKPCRTPRWVSWPVRTSRPAPPRRPPRLRALVGDGVTVRDRETGVSRVRSAPATSPSSSARARAIASSRMRWRWPACRPTSTKGLGFFDADEIKDLLALLWYLAEPASDLRAAAFLRSRFVRLSDEALRRLAPGLADALADSPTGLAPSSMPPMPRAPGRCPRLVGPLAGPRRSHAAGRARRSRAARVAPTASSCAGRGSSRRARTSRSSARCCAGFRTAATPRWGASPRTSTGWPSATNPTPRSMPPTPST